MKLFSALICYMTILLHLPFAGRSQFHRPDLKFISRDKYNKIGVVLPSRGALPASVDLSVFMPPVLNQESQNSCAAWGVALSYSFPVGAYLGAIRFLNLI